MAIRNKMNAGDIHADFLRRVGILDKVIVQRLSQLCEEAVEMSRDALNINPDVFPVTINGQTGQPLKQRHTGSGSDPVFGDYQDQTANLRASIGYLVAKKGVPVKSNFQSSNSRALAEEIARRYASGWVGIVIAGEDYALAVESRGYNVISSAEHMVKNKIGPMIAKIKSSIPKMK